MMARTAGRKLALSTLAAMLAAVALTLAAGGAQAAAPTARAAAYGAQHRAHGARRRHHGRHHARHHARHTRRRHHASPTRRRHHHGGPHFSGGLTVSTGRTVAAPQVPAGPCPNANLEPSAADLAQINQATLCLVNKERVARGLAALAENAKLDAAAAHHSNDMIARNYFDHTAPGGETFDQRIRATGYIPGHAGFALGENIAAGTRGLDTPAQIVASWMNSPEHRANILDPDYQETGVAATAAVPAQFAGGQPGATYTQDFGAIT
jgi:uncharacterized protein YkwD